MAIIYPNKSYNFSENVTDPKPEDILSNCKKMNYPLNIVSLIKEYNITICEEDMEHDISGYIEKREKQWVIGVNKYHSEQRKRFTLAHEYAHYILHRHEIQDKHKDMALFRNNEISLIEIEANNFAGELLIPREKFVKYISNGIKKISDLADNFNVSISAIRYKAYKLGYLNSV